MFLYRSKSQIIFLESSSPEGQSGRLPSRFGLPMERLTSRCQVGRGADFGPIGSGNLAVSVHNHPHAARDACLFRSAAPARSLSAPAIISIHFDPHGANIPSFERPFRAWDDPRPPGWTGLDPN